METLTTRTSRNFLFSKAACYFLLHIYKVHVLTKYLHPAPCQHEPDSSGGKCKNNFNCLSSSKKRWTVRGNERKRETERADNARSRKRGYTRWWWYEACLREAKAAATAAVSPNKIRNSKKVSSLKQASTRNMCGAQKTFRRVLEFSAIYRHIHRT